VDEEKGIGEIFNFDGTRSWLDKCTERTHRLVVDKTSYNAVRQAISS